MADLNHTVPRWAVPLLSPCRYKGASGGRSSGKSHEFAEMLVLEMVKDKDKAAVCIREIQKSLKFSAKRLIENKIRSMGVSHMFEIQESQIKRVGGSGVILFQGMQNHTADSIKSLEGFHIAWVEEAQSISARSLELLLPTIRAEGSEIWFTWNPDQETDPVDMLFSQAEGDPDFCRVHVNFTDNPFCPQEVKDEAARHLRYNPDTYDHVWLGAYNTKSDDQVLAGKWRVDQFEPDPMRWDGPYYGSDFGFATDPSTLVKCWIHDNRLYIEDERYKHGVETDHLPDFYKSMEGAQDHVIRADNARPENISYLNRHGFPKVQSVEKWPGSVEDGISKMRSFDEIVIHERCKYTQQEARLYKYKRDRLTDDILPQLIDANNHCIDAIRYAIAPIIKGNGLSDLLKIAVKING